MLTPHRKHIQMLHWRQCQLAPVILRPQRQQGLVRHASDIVSSFQKGVFRDFEATTNGKVERRVKQILVPEAMHAISMQQHKISRMQIDFTVRKLEKKVVVLFVLMLIVGIVIGSTAGYMISANQASSLKNQVATLQTENSELQNQTWTFGQRYRTCKVRYQC